VADAMKVGERIKIARRTAEMSQRDLAEAVGVSATAISKYERGLNVPSSDVLLRLAQALGVKTEFFLRPVTVTLTTSSFRRRASLPRKKEYAILGQIQEWLERYLDAESLFVETPSFDFPDALNPRVASVDDAERVAQGLRQAWDLGLAPIESLMEILEDRGIKVGLVDGHEGFDALTFWMEDEVPVIAVKRGLPGDRQRFSLAHELGHLILEPLAGVDDEKAAFRFAGAFLVTEEVARFELGSRRQRLDPYELHLLKHKYGLSMQAWVYRAKDLGILSESAATQLFRQFRQQSWHRQEPGDQIPSEEPQRMKRLVLRALAEDLISESRAAELLGKPLSQFWQDEAGQHEEFSVAVRR
jgi:Zn-dependent peptidase ImmA (M78 family)/transcriptional regulator with XRE-family HTH domain